MNMFTRTLLATTACAGLALAPQAHAQFDTVLNLPADGSIAGSAIIGTPGSDHTQVNIGAGGSVGTFSTLTGGSEINVNGGAVGTNFTAQAGSTVNVNSGNMGTDGGNVNTFEAGSVLTVVDGAFGRVLFFGEATLGGGTYNHFVDFGAGSVSTVNGGTFVFDSLDAFAGSTLTINGGTFSIASKFAGDLTVNGGTFGVGTNFFADTIITGGTFGSFVSFGENIAAGNGTVNVTGGDFLGNIDINSGIANISGGTFLNSSNGGDFELFAGGTLNLTGTSFNLNGIALGTGVHVITDRDVNLDGVLLDGSAFAVALNSTNSGDFFDPNATLTVTVVPEPGSLALLGLGGLALLRRRR